MLTLRSTKKLARQLGPQIPTRAPTVASRVADWCLHSFTLGDEIWLVFCNTASLYPVFGKAFGVKDEESLIRRTVGMILLVLRENGYKAQAKTIERELILGVQWAPIPDRSILGSISEMIWLADAYFDDANLTPGLLSRRLGETPMSALGMNQPSRAFTSLRA